MQFTKQFPPAQLMVCPVQAAPADPWQVKVQLDAPLQLNVPPEHAAPADAAHWREQVPDPHVLLPQELE